MFERCRNAFIRMLGICRIIITSVEGDKMEKFLENMDVGRLDDIFENMDVHDIWFSKTWTSMF